MVNLILVDRRHFSHIAHLNPDDGDNMSLWNIYIHLLLGITTQK
jgi:hypothetical protein